MRAFLVFGATGNWQRVPVEQAEMLIGRDPGCQLRISGNEVSRKHCLLSLREGQLFLKDRKSSNGTFVNKRRLDPNEEVELADGDYFQVGTHVFTVAIEPEADNQLGENETVIGVKPIEVPADVDQDPDARGRFGEGAAQSPPTPRKRSTVEMAFSAQTVVTTYPAPIAIAYRRFCGLKEPRLRLEAIFLALEATLRYLVIIGISDLLGCLARKTGTDAQLPDHTAFDLVRFAKPMQLGSWVETLRETARALAAEPQHVLLDFPEVCDPRGKLVNHTLAELVQLRNQSIHPQGGVPSNYGTLLRTARPLLEEALQSIRFVCDLPLGFVQESPVVSQSGTMPAAGFTRYYLHSCMGAKVGNTHEAYVFQASLPFASGVPFVVTPDDEYLLYLWPLLSQQVSPVSGRHTLYAFERIPSRSGLFLSKVYSHAIDSREDDWEQEFYAKPTLSHEWLLDELRKLPTPLQLPDELQLADYLMPNRGGSLVGRQLGPNHLHHLIGSGGSASVYAGQSQEGKQVAVKVIEWTDAHRQFPRFQREFQKLKHAGQHPGIIECYEQGVELHDGREIPWYSMAFAIGGDLGGRILDRRSKDPTRLPWDDPGMRAEIMSEFQAITEAVAHLHALGIVHRDLKPGNILIMEDGSLRLSDFGLVKNLQPSHRSLLNQTSTAAIVGTRDYMAPEQERGEEVDKAADVYALGIILAELCCGERPSTNTRVPGGSTIASSQKLRRLPRPLRKLIEEATSVHATTRLADAGQLRERFLACAELTLTSDEGSNLV